ncbi:NADH:ubiquinone oxidoreductase subunit 4 (chain M) [Microbacterium sp. 1P10UB]|uniref:NADH:ubiquinone oxidoreductase subunit 4 (chain M) n=1 Tax=unclassified Microbacterium TaxID=2609290 RepID=UPI0039A2E8FD
MTYSEVVRRLAVSLAAAVMVGAVLAGCTIPTEKWTDPLPYGEFEDDALDAVNIYRVSDGVLEPEPSVRAQEVWDAFREVAGERAHEVREFRAGDSKDVDTLAYVSHDSDPRFWVLAANLAFSREGGLTETLVHEYAHSLSLSSDQLDLGRHAACATFEIADGCARAASYIVAFDDAFWQGYASSAPGPDSQDANAAAALYAEHEADFVTGYAATNVGEDFAESFSVFVAEPTPTGQDDSPIADKLRFFYGYPDLVAERDRIRSAVGY